MNNWCSIWNNRKMKTISMDESTKEIMRSLKSLMGLATKEQIDIAKFIEQLDENIKKMAGGGLYSRENPCSFFEVGCGSGMNLYYLGSTNKGSRLGGVDYSAPLIEAAKKALCSPNIPAQIEELYCAEAIEIDTRNKYDCVFARSVFQYFPCERYGMEVAEKMLLKADSCVGIFDVFDTNKREQFLAYRRSMIENFDEKYANTPHQFYPKEMFLRLAEQYNCDILFSRDPLPGYWNEPFVYDVYLYKRH